MDGRIERTIYCRRKIALLDRDGTIVEYHDGYLTDVKDICIIAYGLLRYLQDCGYALVVITNQSIISRGIATLCQVERVNDAIVNKYRKQNIYIDAVFMCPHQPDDECYCRKPKVGLLRAVDAAITMDRSRSVVIGDAESDVAAGQSYGIGTNILIPVNQPWHAMDELEIHERFIGSMDRSLS